MLEAPVPIRTMKLSLDSTWMGDRLGTPVAADKKQSRALLREHVRQSEGGKLFQGTQTLGKSGLCSGQLAGRPENWTLERGPCGPNLVRKA